MTDDIKEFVTLWMIMRKLAAGFFERNPGTAVFANVHDGGLMRAGYGQINSEIHDLVSDGHAPADARRKRRIAGEYAWRDNVTMGLS